MSNAVYPNNLIGLGFTVTKTPLFSTIVNKSSGGSEVRVRNYVNPLWKWTLMYDVLFGAGSSQVTATQPNGYADIDYLMGFFNARSGESDDFLFSDPDDNTVVNQSQLLMTDGAGNWYTPLQRNMGGQFSEDITALQSFTGVYLNSTLIDPSGNWQLLGPGLAIPGASYGAIYISWLPWSAAYSYTVGTYLIDPNRHLQKVTAATGPAGATEPTVWNSTGGTTSDGDVTWTDQGVITTTTATFQFYFRVRFGSDDQDFEKFMKDLWTIGGDEGKNGKGTLELVTSRLSSIGEATQGAPPYLPAIVMTPPPGLAAIVLYPTIAQPTTLTSFSNAIGSIGSAVASAGPFGSISLIRGNSVISDDIVTIVGANQADYQLPAFIAGSQVVAAFAVVSGTKTDGPGFDPNTNPFDNGQVYPAAGYFEINGSIEVQPGPPGSDFYSSFVAASVIRQLAPITPVMLPGLSDGLYDADSNFYPGMSFSASLQQTSNGWMNSTFDGGMVIVVWYRP